MKVIQTSVQLETKILLELNEDEARALSGIFGYNVEEFLKVFYEKMGKSYVKPYEDGVRSLHKSLRGLMDGALVHVEKARKTLKGGGL